MINGGHEGAMKHLTVEMQKSLKGEQRSSAAFDQLKAASSDIQVFETGPVLLAADEPKSHEKFEVHVDSDDLSGDTDNIDISFHQFRDGVETGHSLCGYALALYGRNEEAGKYLASERDFHQHQSSCRRSQAVRKIWQWHGDGNVWSQNRRSECIWQAGKAKRHGAERSNHDAGALQNRPLHAAIRKSDLLARWLIWPNPILLILIPAFLAANHTVATSSV